MRFNLLNRIQSHADHDQEGGSTKIEGDVELSIENRWKDADDRYINRPSEGDSSQHLIDIFCRLLPRPDTGNITTEFLHVFGDVIRIECDGRVKIAEEYNEPHVKKIIEEGTRA